MSKLDTSVLQDIYTFAQAVDVCGDLFAEVKASSDAEDGYTEHLRIVICRRADVIVEASVLCDVGTSISDTDDELLLELKRIPIEQVRAVLTAEEVDEYNMCVAADQSMLDNAY
jgi:hypothetical protein